MADFDPSIPLPPFSPILWPLDWWVHAEVPYDAGWSKNRMWLRNRFGGYRISPEARAHRQRLGLRLQEALRGRRIAHNRLWLWIRVDKGDHRGDALNALDLVSDAVQDATGLDDKWYQIGALSWNVTSSNPRVQVWIGQTATDDVQICSRCKRELPLDAYHRNRSAKLGRASSCKDCVRTPAS